MGNQIDESHSYTPASPSQQHLEPGEKQRKLYYYTGNLNKYTEKTHTAAHPLLTTLAIRFARNDARVKGIASFVAVFAGAGTWC